MRGKAWKKMMLAVGMVVALSGCISVNLREIHCSKQEKITSHSEILAQVLLSRDRLHEIPFPEETTKEVLEGKWGALRTFLVGSPAAMFFLTPDPKILVLDSLPPDRKRQAENHELIHAIRYLYMPKKERNWFAAGWDNLRMEECIAELGSIFLTKAEGKNLGFDLMYCRFLNIEEWDNAFFAAQVAAEKLIAPERFPGCSPLVPASEVQY